MINLINFYILKVISEHFHSFEDLFNSNEQDIKNLLNEYDSKDEEIRRIITAQRNLKSYTEKLMLGEAPNDMELHWDSWDRTKSNANSISSTGTSPRISRNRVTRTSEDILKSSPLSPPQSAGPWSSSFGSYNLVSNNSSNLKERRATPPPTPPLTNRKNASDKKFPTTPPPTKKHQANLLADPFPLTKSKSHEEHLAHRIDPLDSALAK